MEGARWEYKVDAEWLEFPAAITSTLESSWLRSESGLTFSRDGRHYEVKFEDMCEVDAESGETRSVRRSKKRKLEVDAGSWECNVGEGDLEEWAEFPVEVATALEGAWLRNALIVQFARSDIQYMANLQEMTQLNLTTKTPTVYGTTVNLHSQTGRLI